MLTVTKNPGSFRPVRAEEFDPDPNWRAPFYRKAHDQREQIKLAASRALTFSSLSPAKLEQVIDAFQGPLIATPGTELVRQGNSVTPGDPGIYVLMEGILDVFKRSQGQTHPGTHVCSYDERGQCFGELSLLHDCPRAATVIVRSRAVLWQLDKDTFDHCVKGAALAQRERYRFFLANTDPFSGLDETELQRVVDVVRERTYENGDVICRKGEEGREFFIIVEGSASAIVASQRVKAYSSGDYFGELALLRQQPRAADIVAGVSPTTVLVIDADSFRFLPGPLTEFIKQRAAEYTPPRR